VAPVARTLAPDGAGRALAPAAARIPCRSFLIVPHAAVRGQRALLTSRRHAGIEISHPTTIENEAKVWRLVPVEAVAWPPGLNTNPFPENVSYKSA
jgi:hypothetical protein